MHTTKMSDEGHLTLITLWDYRMNHHMLSTEQYLHIARCEDCLSLLGLCQISESLAEVERRLRARR
jgi:hypothetical protein